MLTFRDNLIAQFELRNPGCVYMDCHPHTEQCVQVCRCQCNPVLYRAYQSLSGHARCTRCNCKR